MSKNVIKMKLPYINNNNSLTILMEWKIAVISNIQHHCIAPANNNNTTANQNLLCDVVEAFIAAFFLIHLRLELVNLDLVKYSI